MNTALNAISENTKGDLDDPYFKSPVSKREKRLELTNRLLLGIIFLLILIIGVGLFLAIITPKPILVVDRGTGEIIGEYQTTAYRTDDELMGAAKIFLQYHLSFNSDSVYDDFSKAIGMMANDLRKKRVEYLKKSNLAFDIISAKSKSTLSFDDIQIISKKNDITTIDLKGDLIFLAGSTKTSRAPYHFILTLKSVPVTSINTTGVQILDYEEKEVQIDENDNNSK